MIELIKTDLFDRWLVGLRDRQARARIEARIRRLSLGNPGDVKPVGEGLSEMRIDHGPGYRVYFSGAAPWWCCCFVEATRAVRNGTLP